MPLRLEMDIWRVILRSDGVEAPVELGLVDLVAVPNDRTVGLDLKHHGTGHDGTVAIG